MSEEKKNDKPTELTEEKHPGGRPTELTEENKESILKFIREGMTYKDAAILTGIGESTLRKYRTLGIEARKEDIQNEYIEFLEEMDRAKIEYKKSLVDSVTESSKKDGKLALEVLSRKWSDEYGRKDKLSLSGQLDVVNYDIKYTPEEEEECKRRFASFFNKGVSDD